MSFFVRMHFEEPRLPFHKLQREDYDWTTDGDRVSYEVVEESPKQAVVLCKKNEEIKYKTILHYLENGNIKKILYFAPKEDGFFESHPYKEEEYTYPFEDSVMYRVKKEGREIPTEFWMRALFSPQGKVTGAVIRAINWKGKESFRARVRVTRDKQGKLVKETTTAWDPDIDEAGKIVKQWRWKSTSHFDEQGRVYKTEFQSLEGNNLRES